MKNYRIDYTDCPPKNDNQTFGINNFQNVIMNQSKYALGFWNYN